MKSKAIYLFVLLVMLPRLAAAMQEMYDYYDYGNYNYDDFDSDRAIRSNEEYQPQVWQYMYADMPERSEVFYTKTEGESDKRHRGGPYFAQRGSGRDYNNVYEGARDSDRPTNRPTSVASSSSPSPAAPGGPANSANPQPMKADQEDKTKKLQELVQHMYVAQARAQLEATEIRKAQGVADAAQSQLEEAANNVRSITTMLQTAQQAVASAAIRAQTAQLQLAAHDQLLFAARQDVDALSSQMVGLEASEGVSAPKTTFDLSGLMDKLKEALPESQKPTPVPPVVAMPHFDVVNGIPGGKRAGSGNVGPLRFDSDIYNTRRITDESSPHLAASSLHSSLLSKWPLGQGQNPVPNKRFEAETGWRQPSGIQHNTEYDTGLSSIPPVSLGQSSRFNDRFDSSARKSRRLATDTGINDYLEPDEPFTYSDLGTNMATDTDMYSRWTPEMDDTPDICSGLGARVATDTDMRSSWTPEIDETPYLYSGLGKGLATDTDMRTSWTSGTDDSPYLYSGLGTGLDTDTGMRSSWTPDMYETSDTYSLPKTRKSHRYDLQSDFTRETRGDSWADADVEDYGNKPSYAAFDDTYEYGPNNAMENEYYRDYDDY